LLGIAELLGRVAASCFLKSSASDMPQDPTLGAPRQALAMPTVASRKRPVNAAASPEPETSSLQVSHLEGVRS
jgi:hypothetical protein